MRGAIRLPSTDASDWPWRGGGVKPRPYDGAGGISRSPPPYSHPRFRNILSISSAMTMQTPQKIGYEIAYLFSGIGMFIP